MKKKIVILTGAGISAESGIKTFRDADGLWEGHDVAEVASPIGFAKDPHLVLDFYNQRRRQLLEVRPNAAHKGLSNLENKFDVTIITQNIDDLHERGGSSNIVHLHGELLRARSTGDEKAVMDWKTDLNFGDLCKNGHQLRPHIVWFGEEVPLLEEAVRITQSADILMIIGTSMQVYPAAGLVNYVKRGTPIYFIDPKPSVRESEYESLTIIAEKASTAIPLLVEELLRQEA